MFLLDALSTPSTGNVLEGPAKVAAPFAIAAVVVIVILILRRK